MCSVHRPLGVGGFVVIFGVVVVVVFVVVVVVVVVFVVDEVDVVVDIGISQRSSFPGRVGSTQAPT